ncbi:hypothetical protein N0B31_08530 [Salinirubellus salinus]|uniref:Uncharacterized protein n=1 Tax=Salinirubellus salinus TaxID=1364945 RepID=A0A9E7UCW3_9EURY|nr:hypothetical protein [Salinirubellus salinus]UWM56329.1 hypothetical protein N0B31_08530 [Salinirubellus salinus]
MAQDPTADVRPDRQSFTLDADNTFQFLPGPMLGVSCPTCFRDQLLREILSTGVCTHCGTELEVTLTARVDGAVQSG